MMDDAPLALAAGFEPADREAWCRLVEKVLKGGDFEKRLVSKTADGLRVEPLYTREAALGAGGAARTGSGWDIRTIVIESDPGAANRAILEDLEGGASSVALQIASGVCPGLAPEKESLGQALAGVILDTAPIALVPLTAFREAAASLLSVWTERGVENPKRLGAFNADPLGALTVTGDLGEPIEKSLAAAADLARSALSMSGVTALLADGVAHHNAGASEAQELAAMLATCAAYLRACETAGLPPNEALPKIAVSLAAGADQFLAIAKFRAARRLVARIAEACGAGAAAARVQFGAATSYRMMAKRDPWTNILRGAVGCAGAALGGADAIVVLPFTMPLGRPDAPARRIARNTQLVLQEESSLGRVADPAAGSWYVETLTRDLAAKAWSLFQEIEKQGGMAAALQTGFIQDEIAKTAEARAKDIATRRVEITGVSAFPKLGGDGVTADPWPRPAPVRTTTAVDVRPLRAVRLAEAFEALRDAADAASPAPRVFLANLGAIADHNQRSTWTQNLLAAGGVETLASDGYASAAEAAEAFKASGASVACLASSDEIYGGRAEETARLLKASGARYVFLAGRPFERETALRAAGVDGFLFAGQDMVATLKGLHGMLGVGH